MVMMTATVMLLIVSAIPIPTINWEEWQLVGIILLVCGAAFWRFEIILRRNAADQKEQRDWHAMLMKEISGDNKATMEKFATSIQGLVEGVRQGDREIVERLIVHDARIAAIAQALSSKEELTPTEVKLIYDTIRREKP